MTLDEQFKASLKQLTYEHRLEVALFLALSKSNAPTDRAEARRMYEEAKKEAESRAV